MEIGWICKFDLSWYPYGIQKCSLIFYAFAYKDNVRIHPVSVNFSGFMIIHVTQNNIFDISASLNNMDLYQLQDIKFCAVENVFDGIFDEIDSRQGVVVEIFLKRPINSFILTQFLPTTLFVIIRFAFNSTIICGHP